MAKSQDNKTLGRLLATAITCTSTLFVVASSYLLYRRQRTKWQQDENSKGDEIHSIIAHFQETLTLAPETTVEEANKQRTRVYYEKFRQAHLNVLVPGVGSHETLLELRRKELDRILYYYKQGTKSHRTVVTMCDSTTASILSQARETILCPLNYSTDPSSKGVWIPELNIMPNQDMHVTIFIPWWWHTMRQANAQLTQELAARFRQALVLKFHHPFQIELERIILLGGQTLVALWRCVGERVTEDGHFIYDRHGESVDPFVRLRVEIVRCFTEDSPSLGQPLTYNDTREEENISLPHGQIPKPSPLIERQNTIEFKTPGMGQGDGFIHTTLARLPLNCLSPSDVSLDKVHRLCREASATLSGHRMVVNKFRFLETTGRGGESNPCRAPIFDESMEAPSRVHVDRAGAPSEIENMHVQIVNEASWTVGAVAATVERTPMVALADLFDFERGKSDSSVVTITAPVLI